MLPFTFSADKDTCTWTINPPEQIDGREFHRCVQRPCFMGDDLLISIDHENKQVWSIFDEILQPLDDCYDEELSLIDQIKAAIDWVPGDDWLNY